MSHYNEKNFTRTQIDSIISMFKVVKFCPHLRWTQCNENFLKLLERKRKIIIRKQYEPIQSSKKRNRNSTK